MRSLHIDRLSLELNGDIDMAGGGRDMAIELITQLAAAGGLPGAGDYPVVRVSVPMVPNERRSDLTARIVAQALLELRRGTG
jgi:hypothetical protein